MKSSKNKFILPSILIILGLIAVYFTLFSGGKKKNRQIVKKDNKNFLFAAASNPNENNPCLDENGNPIKGCRNNQKGLFDENNPDSFMGNKGMDFSEEAEKLAGADGEYPMNPQTGKPYDDEAMGQFDELRKYFPTNDLIPKKMTKLDKERKAEQDNKVIKAMNAVTSGKYTVDDAVTHFDAQKKNAQDRVEIIEYLIESSKEDGEIDKDGQFQKVLDTAKEQMKQIETQKQEALSKLK